MPKATYSIGKKCDSRLSYYNFYALIDVVIRLYNAFAESSYLPLPKSSSEYTSFSMYKKGFTFSDGVLHVDSIGDIEVSNSINIDKPITHCTLIKVSNEWYVDLRTDYNPYIVLSILDEIPVIERPLGFIEDSVETTGSMSL